MGSSILNSGRSNMFGDSDRFPSVSSSSVARRCEEEAVAWAAMERLPTCELLRTSTLNDAVNNHYIASSPKQIDDTNIPPQAQKKLIDRLLGVLEEDNQRFLLKLRHKLDRVGIISTEIEIHFQHLNISADVYVGSRAFPSLINWTVNMVEESLHHRAAGPCNSVKIPNYDFSAFYRCALESQPLRHALRPHAMSMLEKLQNIRHARLHLPKCEHHIVVSCFIITMIYEDIPTLFHLCQTRVGLRRLGTEFHYCHNGSTHSGRKIIMVFLRAISITIYFQDYGFEWSFQGICTTNPEFS